jgi:hypothetical protein
MSAVVDPILYVIWPPILAGLGLIVWKLAYDGRRPLSPGVKVIVVVIIVWFCLPVLACVGLYALDAMGGHPPGWGIE